MGGDGLDLERDPALGVGISVPRWDTAHRVRYGAR